MENELSAKTAEPKTLTRIERAISFFIIPP
jgi:hypothetical protein